MNLTFACRQCKRPARIELNSQSDTFACPHCHCIYNSVQRWHDSQLDSCQICGCQELYARKDFSQRLGVAIVLTGILLSSIAWGYHLRFVTYGILFATALIDVVLYFSVGNMLQCYRCQTEYRGLVGLKECEPFNLETHERYRQQAAPLADQGSPSEAAVFSDDHCNK